MIKLPKSIAVDLTPILPGGENGGAKIFVLELLFKLSKIAPQINFILLTQSASHEELALLDRHNVRRIMVIGPLSKNSYFYYVKKIAKRVLINSPNIFGSLFRRLGYRFYRLLKQGGKSRILKGIDVDILFCPFTAPTYHELEIPTVCTIYDLQFKTYPEFFSSADLAHRNHTFVEACRHSTALIAISNYSRNCAIKYGNLDPKRIQTIYLRMSQRIVPKIGYSDDILSRIGLFPRQYLIYPANFWKHKNHEMLLTAFGMACHQGLLPDIKLVLTGSPSARQKWLLRAVCDMNLANRVVFPGYLPNLELTTLMANCSGMVFPSLYEGFGLPVIEAMAAGVAVACSRTTALTEVVGNAAILFNPRVPYEIMQAIITLVNNDLLRIEMIKRGLRRAAEFSDGEQMASEYLEVFQKVMRDQQNAQI